MAGTDLRAVPRGTVRFYQAVSKPTAIALLFVSSFALGAEPELKPLFPKDGPPAGWITRHWGDLGQPAQGNPLWTVKDGALTSSGDRGCWLASEKEYGDFEIEYEFRLGPQGNSGFAFRAPATGDPAFAGKNSAFDLEIAGM